MASDRAPSGARTLKARRTALIAASALLLAACGPGSAPAASPSGSAAPNLGEPGANATIPPQPKAGIQGKIAFGRAGNIWVIAGSETKQLTSILGASDPAWSPDGTSLAFDKQDKNSADLYVMSYPTGPAKALASNSNRVVENNLWEMQPDWSPDGTSLAYISDRARFKNGVLDPAPWRLTLASGTRTQLANGNQYAGGIDLPRWRPNHKNEILFTSWAYDPQTLLPYGQLMLQDTLTGQAHALTPPTETAFQGAWSPDGSSIVFIKRQQQRDDLWIMSAPEVTGTAATSTASPAEAHQVASGRMAQPVWSPDGHAVAYIGLKDGGLDIFVQPLSAQLQAEGSPAQLTTSLHVEGASTMSWGR